MTAEAPAPLLHLPLDRVEAGMAPDLTGNGHAGALEGDAAPVADDLLGACMGFNGAGHVAVPHHPSLLFGGEMTVEAWVLLSARVAGPVRIAAKGGGEGRNYVLWVHDGTSWMFQWNHYAEGYVVAAPPIGLNRWYHLAGTRRQGRATLLVHDSGGRLLAEAARSISGHVGRSEEPLEIGRQFKGRIGRLRLFPVGLTREQVERGIAADVREGRLARLDDLRRWAPPRPALRLDGAGMSDAPALLSAGTLPRPGLRHGFTLEAFLRFGAGGPRGVGPRRVIAAFGGADGWVLSLERGLLTFRIAVTHAVEAGAEPARHRAVRMVQEPDAAAAAREAAPQAWRHVAVVASPGTEGGAVQYALHVDGRPVALHVGGRDEASAAGAEDRLAIGALAEPAPGEGHAPFRGAIAELRLWDRALAEREIALNLARRLAGHEFGLLACWPIGGAADGLVAGQGPAACPLRLGIADPGWIPADAPEAEAGPRLIDAGIAIHPPAEIDRLRAEVAHWRRLRMILDEDTGAFVRTVAAVQAEREALEAAADRAEQAALAAESAAAERLRDLRATLAAERDQMAEKVARGEWTLGEVIEAVDQQLREARETAAAQGAYRLDQLTLDLKALPLAGGTALRFPDAARAAALPAAALSTVRFDFESRERFEAAQPRLVPVPDVTGLTEALARRRLAAAGLLMEVAHRAVPVDPRQPGLAERQVGTVREQVPAPGEAMAMNGRVKVYVGLRARGP